MTYLPQGKFRANLLSLSHSITQQLWKWLAA